MPKGDRELFKADTEDGYTKIADLLLEALAMAKLNGVQKGICMFLWRRTYGWDIKEDQIALKDFAQACDTSQQYISKQLKQLINLNIIIRTSYEPGKVPTYSFNTRVTEWDKGCINVQGLNECIKQGSYKCMKQGLHECARVNQSSDQENQELTPSLYTDYRHSINNNDDHDRAREEKPNLYKKFEQEFGRPLSPMEFEEIQDWEGKFTYELITEALRKAVFMGKFNFKYINSILNNWKNNNIRTVTEVHQYDEQYQKNKDKSEVRIRGSDKKQNSKPGGENKPGQAEVFKLDRSKFEFQG